jgi:hypothetical protein
MGVLSVKGFEAECCFVDWFLDVVCAFDIKVICHVISFAPFVVDGSGLGCSVDVPGGARALTRRIVLTCQNSEARFDSSLSLSLLSIKVAVTYLISLQVVRDFVGICVGTVRY